ncbi:MAG: hypothetical protein LBS89_01705 [Zoogloeaceae bacterium]|jgi:hypothetical protein|nr:hypothetical protein [Zoogloeaceae bacterium]
MTALTQDHNTPRRDAVDFEFPVAAGVWIHAGGIVALTSTGDVAPGGAANTLAGIGIAQEAADNRTGAGGDRRVKVRRGCYRLKNSPGDDAITSADLWKACYIADDATVAKTNPGGASAPAGIVRDVDSLGVWVEF